MKQKQLFEEPVLHMSKIQLLILAWSQPYLCFFMLLLIIDTVNYTEALNS